jgi:hypothetical protein
MRRRREGEKARLIVGGLDPRWSLNIFGQDFFSVGNAGIVT